MDLALKDRFIVLWKNILAELNFQSHFIIQTRKGQEN